MQKSINQKHYFLNYAVAQRERDISIKYSSETRYDFCEKISFLKDGFYCIIWNYLEIYALDSLAKDCNYFFPGFNFYYNKYEKQYYFVKSKDNYSTLKVDNDGDDDIYELKTILRGKICFVLVKKNKPQLCFPYTEEFTFGTYWKPIMFQGVLASNRFSQKYRQIEYIPGNYRKFPYKISGNSLLVSPIINYGGNLSWGARHFVNAEFLLSLEVNKIL